MVDTGRRGRLRRLNRVRRTRQSGGVVARTKTVIPPNLIATKDYVKRILHKNVETKFWQDDHQTDASSAGTIIDLSEVPQSTSAATDTTRIGDEIVIRGLHINFIPYWRPSPTISFSMIRVVVFQYTANSNGNPPTPGMVLDPVFINTQFYPLAHHNKDYSASVHVLYDSIFTFNNTMNKGTAYMKKINMKYAKKKINYEAGSDEGINKLYMLYVSDTATGNANIPSIQILHRLYYDDA